MSRAFLVLFTLLFPSLVWAQLDSSSAVLLRRTGKTPSKQNLDSSRYKIRAPESRKDDEEIGEKPGTMIPTPVNPKAKSKTATTKATTEVTVSETAEPIPSPVPPEVKPEEVKNEEKAAVETAPANVTTLPASEAKINNPQPAPQTEVPVTQQVRDLILGGTQEDIQEVRSQIHPQDPRSNVVEISMAPAYFYADSKSSYSYRRYNTNGPGFGLGMNLWLTPFFGLQSRYFASVSSGVRSGGTDMVPIDIQTFNAGVRFRKHFGYTRKAAHINWGIDYHDEINKIGREATTIVGRKTSGITLSLEAVVPASVTYAHTLQVDVRPRMKHSEQAAGFEAKSGSKAETNGVGLSLGGQWNLDRRNQVFWKGQYSVERNMFKGSASTPDPHTGNTPDGVGVTNNLMMLYFGFKWGS